MKKRANITHTLELESSYLRIYGVGEDRDGLLNHQHDNSKRISKKLTVVEGSVFFL